MNEQPATTLKILLAEDSLTQAVHMQRMLKTQGWEITVVRNGKEGLEKMRTFLPDVILSDLNMPEMDGFEFCRIVKEGKFRTIPFIILSVHGELENQVKGLDIGADDYLTKPPHELELFARIRSAIRIKSYQDQLEQHLQRMLEELEQARLTQKAILPQTLPSWPQLKLAVKYVPAAQIGGDLYDVMELPQNKLGLFLGDVTGHGISAALISAMVSSMLKSYALSITSPEILLWQMNNFIVDKLESGKFITAWYGIYDIAEKKLSLACAGHPFGYLLRHRTTEVIPLNVLPFPPLGILPSELFIQGLVRTDSLETGDKVFIYTDGVTEAHKASGEMFEVTGLESFLRANSNMPLEQLLEQLYRTVQEYAGRDILDDDITMLAFEVL
ncbi:MAG: fused response regulator/phosphatase [SAR324 cluster bacterium]|nr:fused response regulator/phosphatase [SAR324 cluster bacterium]